MWRKENTMNKRWLAILIPLLLVLALTALAEGEAETSLTVNLNAETVAVNNSIEASWEATGFDGSVMYSCQWHVTEGDQQYQVAEHNGIKETTSAFAPEYGESGRVVVFAFDDLGNFKMEENTFTITGSPPAKAMNLELKLDKYTAAADQGEHLTASWTATGGESPYTYEYVIQYYDEEGKPEVTPTSKNTDETSVVFQPKYGVSGEVTVIASDSMGRSVIKMVEFDVTGGGHLEPINISITLDKDSVAVNQNEAITASWTVSGGTEPYRTNYYWEVDGEYMGSDNEADATTSTYRPKFGESGKVHVYVYDGMDNYESAEKTFTITGSEPADPLELTVTTDKNSYAIDKGEVITARWEAKGGTAPYEFDFYWNLYEEGSNEGQYFQGIGYTTDLTGSFKPAFGVRCELSVSVTDKLGRRAYKSTPVTLTGAPSVEGMVLILQLDKSTVAIDKNERITGTWEAQGGVKPYTYSYYWIVTDKASGEENWVSSGHSTTTTSRSFQPTYGYKGVLEVVARDQRGFQVPSSKKFDITGDPESLPLQLDLSLDKTSVTVGETITVSCTPSGGIAPYSVSYYWKVKSLQDEYWQYDDGLYGTTATTSSFVPRRGIVGQVEVRLEDATGRNLYKSINFDIKGEQKAEDLVLSIDLDKSSVNVGEAVKASWTASGGVAPLTFTSKWNIHDNAMNMSSTAKYTDYTTANEDTFVPTWGDRCTFAVTVTDGRGVSVTEGKTFEIIGGSTTEPLVVTLSLDKDSVDAGNKEGITASWAASGGAGGYTYALNWTISEYSSGMFSNRVRSLEKITGTSDTLNVVFGKKGVVSVTVRDKDGRSSYDEMDFVITGSEPAEVPIEATITLGSNQVKAFGEQTASVEVKGGEAPYTYAFKWYTGIWLDGYQTFSTQAESATATSAAEVPNWFATCYVEVTVKDAKGRIHTAAKDFEVLLDVTRGDANADGRVNTADLGAIVEYIINTIPPKSMENANANKDDKVNIDDLVYIINMLVGD